MPQVLKDKILKARNQIATARMVASKLATKRSTLAPAKSANPSASTKQKYSDDVEGIAQFNHSRCMVNLSFIYSVANTPHSPLVLDLSTQSNRDHKH